MTSILVAGVAIDWLEEAASKGIDIGERNKSSKVEASAKILQQDLKSFQNTHLEVVRLHPGDQENWDKFVTTFRSKRWDGISYGGGVRTIPELGDYFTELIHLAMKEQPQAKLIFPLLPEDVGPAIRKYLPQAM